MGKLPPLPLIQCSLLVLSSVASLFGSIGIGGGGAKAPNVHDGNSSRGVSQHDFLRIDAKDTCTILAIIFAWLRTQIYMNNNG